MRTSRNLVICTIMNDGFRSVVTTRFGPFADLSAAG